MDRVNYRRLHDELVGVQSDAFKHYFEQTSKIGCNLYRCSMSICYGDQTFEAVGFGTVFIIAMEEASSSLIDKLQAQNLLGRNLVNHHQQQLEEEKKKNYELNGQLMEARDRIETLEQKVTELEKCEKGILDDVLTAMSGSNPLLVNGLLIQENGQSRREKIIKELKRFSKSSQEEKLLLQQVYSEKEKLINAKENEIKLLKADLAKGNEIIKKLHEQLKSASYKVSILGEVATKQDEVVESKDAKIKKMESDLKNCIEKLRKRESEIDNLKDEVKVLRSRYESSKEQIKTNENVITWLNKQLADLRVEDGKAKADENGTRRRTFGTVNPAKESTTTKCKVIIPELPRINLVSQIESENLNTHKPSTSRYKPI